MPFHGITITVDDSLSDDEIIWTDSRGNVVGVSSKAGQVTIAYFRDITGCRVNQKTYDAIKDNSQEAS